MIINSLVDFYDLMLESGEVPPMGWSRERVAWEFVIDEDGALISVVPLADDERAFVLKDVPEHGTKTSGIKPFFLCDKAAILLGRGTERNLKEHEASIEWHRAFLDGIADLGARAVLKFLERGHDEDVASVCDGNLDGNAVIRLLGDTCYIHERPVIKDLWDGSRVKWTPSKKTGKATKSDTGKRLIQCAVTGQIAEPAVLFPMVTGVPHAQSSGASLVSFNVDAFCSYGKSAKDQAANSCMSAEAAFKAGAALRYLMRDRRHQVTLGLDKVLFWTEKEVVGNLNDVSLFLDLDAVRSEAKEDESQLAKIEERLKSIKEGRPSLGIDGDTHYYVMCVSPNMARLSVRFFETGTIGSLEKRFGQYLRDIEIVGAADKIQSIRSYVRQTAPLGKEENVPATMVASVMRAMLRGEAFPNSLYVQLLSRMRADKGYLPGSKKPRDAMGNRVSMLKACLLRSARLRNDQETERSLTVSLNEDNVNKGYILGRLFATLEKAQRDALGGNINATIRDRYIGAASTTPARVFPQLLKLAQHHISKAEYGSSIEKSIETVMAKLNSEEGFPATLSLQDQGQFYIGYYQQREALYTKKTTTEEN